VAHSCREAWKTARKGHRPSGKLLKSSNLLNCPLKLLFLSSARKLAALATTKLGDSMSEGALVTTRAFAGQVEVA